ncbi:MAG TPA: iron ABC transporter permease [Stellaceae bacterium]|nr:iron ABC transporter permease [Stellaceae bacterium]
MRFRRRPPALFPLAVTAGAFLFLGVFLLLPLASVLWVSFYDETGTHFTLANYAKIARIHFYQASLWNSVSIGFLSTLTTTAIGLPFAFCLARLPLAGKSVLTALTVLPLVLPSFVGAYALVLMFGRSGVVSEALRSIGIPFGSLYGTPGLVLVYTLTLFPYVVLPTIAAFKAVDVSIEEAAQNLGSPRWRTFRTVVIPVVLPAVLAGALLVFMETLENFGVPFVLAEDKPILAVEAYKLFVGELGGNPSSAAVLSVMLVACTTAALLLQRFYLARRRFATGARAAPPLLRTSAAWRALATLYCWGVIFLALVPFFGVVVISFMKFRGPVIYADFSLGNFTEFLAHALRPLLNTFYLSTAAALVAALIGVPVGYVVTRRRAQASHLLDVIAMAPFAIAGTVLGIGLVLCFNGGWLVLTGGSLILVIAYAVRKVPFNVRASSAILHQLDPTLEEASINLGVSPARTFLKLTLPLMLGGIVGGMVLTWVTIASELSSTVMLYSPSWRTTTVVMLQALEGNDPGIASASATVLTVVTVLPLMLVYRLLRRNEASLL